MRLLSLLLLTLFSFQSVFAVGQTDTISYKESTQKHNWLYLGSGENIQPLRRMEVKSDVVVVGGGMSGIAAAVAAAREGANVVLINDRPVLGGNASSEIRVTVNSPHFERNTGIVEEILLDNRWYNPQESYTTWDHVLYNYVAAEENITLMQNTSAIRANTKGNKIESVVCWQLLTETEVTLKAPIFIDCTGDGVIGASAGAEYRTGREGKEEFGEKYAPDEPDGWVMGESIMMITRELDQPVPFRAPSYAKKFNPTEAKHRAIKELKEGFWWLELGSDYDIIADRPKNHHELMAYFYGIWDYVKNSGDFPQASNLAIEWVGSLPGKRESRRLMGDYILTEGDLTSYREFDDAVAWGGWSLDEHCPGGILSLDEPASYFHAKFTRPYQIPYRSLYSKNIDNLLFAGRDVSVSHIALSSTRIIETCMSMGQATGVAAAICIEQKTSPRGVYQNHIDELQERMLRKDYYIPYRAAEDPDNKAKDATITASSTRSGDVSNLLDGVARDEQGEVHHWSSKGTEASLELKWDEVISLSQLELKFDTNVHRAIMMYKNPTKNAKQIIGIPPELVRNFSVEALINGQWQEIANIEDNIRRYVPLTFETIETNNIRINLHSTHGANDIKLYEIRCY
ncbi:MAG: FAD-dependent oxidoreductase [Rikenellaceae bacterium]